MYYIKYTLIEFTTIKYCNSDWKLTDTDYENVLEKDLPIVYDQLVLDSFEDFPLDILIGRKINSVRLYCPLEMSNENFEILNELYQNGSEIKFYKHSTEYTSWFDSGLRIKTIQSIINQP